MTKKILILAFILLVFILVSLITSFILVKFYFSPERMRFMIMGSLSESFGKEVIINKADIDIFRGKFELQGFGVYKKTDSSKKYLNENYRKSGEIFYADRVIMDIYLLPLLKGDINIKRIGFVNPEARLSRLPSIEMDEALFERKLFSFTNTRIEGFFIENGTLIFLSEKTGKELIKFYNFNTKAENIDINSPIGLKMNSDVLLGERKMKFNSALRINLIGRILQIDGFSMSMNGMSFDMEGSIYSFIKSPDFHIRLRTRKFLFDKINEVMRLPSYMFSFIPEEQVINIKIEGETDKLNVSLSK